MRNYNKNKKTAAYLVAVFALILLSILSGCVTPRHIDEIKAEIRDVQLQNSSTQVMIAKIDSLLVANAEADKKLRADISYTLGNIDDQIAILLENYNELIEKLDRLDKNDNVIRVLRGSTGVETHTKPTVTDSVPPTYAETPVETLIPASSFNCDSTYDEAFLMVWRSEYKDAIVKLNDYLKQCPDHKSVGDAHYWIGECYYSLEKYPEAIEKFMVLFNSFKSSPKLSSALYKLGRSHQETGKKEDAKNAYQKIIDDYPETLEAKQAKERLKDLKQPMSLSRVDQTDLPGNGIKIILTPPPTYPLVGRGFYQVEEDKLFVQIGEFNLKKSLFSYLESDNFRFDISKSGHPIFLELTIPRRNWAIDKNFAVSKVGEISSLKFIDFRKIIIEPIVTTNKNKDSIRLSFTQNSQSNVTYTLTDNISFEIDQESNLVAIVVNNIIDDFAGQKLKKFRDELKPNSNK